MTEESIASRAEPRLLAGMRILEVDGRPTLGAGYTDAAALEASLGARGQVLLTVEEAEPEGQNPKGRAALFGRSGAPSAPPWSTARGGSSGSVWPCAGKNTAANAEAGEDAEDIEETPSDDEFNAPKGPKGATAAKQLRLRRAVKIVRLSKKALKLPRKAKQALDSAVDEALLSAARAAEGIDGDDEDFDAWTLEAWLSAVEPHRVLSSGLEALLQERLAEMKCKQSLAALDYHFVAALGAMPSERAMKLLISLISHPKVVQAIAALLLDGAGIIARAEPHTAASSVPVRLPSVDAPNSRSADDANFEVGKLSTAREMSDYLVHSRAVELERVPKALLAHQQRLQKRKQQPSSPSKMSVVMSNESSAPEMSVEMSVVGLSLKVSGDAASFNSVVEAQIAQAIAQEAGVDPSAVEVGVTAASVINSNIDVSIHTPKATADSVQSTMANAVSSVLSATVMLTSAKGVSITVLAVTKPPTVTPVPVTAVEDASTAPESRPHPSSQVTMLEPGAPLPQLIDAGDDEIRDGARLAAQAIETAQQEREAMTAHSSQEQRKLDSLEIEREALQKAMEDLEARAAKEAAKAEAEARAAAMEAAKEAKAEMNAEHLLHEKQLLDAQRQQLLEEMEKEKARQLKAFKEQSRMLEEQMLQMQAEKERQEREAKAQLVLKEAEAKKAMAELEKAKERDKRRLAEELYITQQQLLQSNLSKAQEGVPVILDRYVENNPAGFDLKYGTLNDFRGGLHGLLGEDMPARGDVLSAMEADHVQFADCDTTFEVYNYGTVTTSRFEFYFVVDPSSTRLKMLGIDEWPVDVKLKAAGRQCRKAESVRSFREARARIATELEEAGSAPLTVEEFFATRLYTGPMYMKYNGTLRGILPDSPPFFQIAFQRLCQGNNYAATIHTINAALVKLSTLQKVQKVYRGLAGKLPKPFRVEDKFAARGGVELGFMSTTTNKKVAAEYAAAAPGSLLIELEQGLLDRGAEVAWLSEYPGEAEVTQCTIRSHMSLSLAPRCPAERPMRLLAPVATPPPLAPPCVPSPRLPHPLP